MHSCRLHAFILILGSGNDNLVCVVESEIRQKLLYLMSFVIFVSRFRVCTMFFQVVTEDWIQHPSREQYTVTM